MVTTSLTAEQASAAEVVVAYRRLLEVESSFRVLKDLIELRPVFHWTEDRVRAHVAVCVLAAVVEAVMEADLRAAGVGDPDIDDQVISPRRSLRELGRIRRVTLTVAERTLERDTRRSALQDRILPPSASKRPAGHPRPPAEPQPAQTKGSMGTNGSAASPAHLRFRDRGVEVGSDTALVRCTRPSASLTVLMLMSETCE